MDRWYGQRKLENPRFTFAIDHTNYGRIGRRAMIHPNSVFPLDQGGGTQRGGLFAGTKVQFLAHRLKNSKVAQPGPALEAKADEGVGRGPGGRPHKMANQVAYGRSAGDEIACPTGECSIMVK